MPGSADAQLGRDVVEVLVLGDELVDHGLVDRVDDLDQVVDAVRVDRDAETQLRLDLVALGDRDVAHVVAEAGELERTHLGGTCGGPGPDADATADVRVADVADDGLARDAEAGLDVAELPVAVRGLVEVHEVHVDRRPRNVTVGLRVQVEERLAQGVEAVDPHLGRRERVHPADQADARVIGVGVEHHPADRVGRGQDGLPHDADREVRVSCQRLGHLARLIGDLLERLLAVEALASGEEPDLAFGGAHGRLLLMGRGAHWPYAFW